MSPVARKDRGVEEFARSGCSKMSLINDHCTWLMDVGMTSGRVPRDIKT